MLTAMGIIIGFVMGLTGAGGALVSIPLFMHFQGMDIKEASVYSLIAVVGASLSNYFYQRKEARSKLALLFVLFSAIGSYLSQPFKYTMPEIGIAIILTIVSIYSLYVVWFPAKKNPSIQTAAEPFLLKTAIIGLGLGVLTTFTGLGGGVLMLPILLGLYGLTEVTAVATSLVVVGLSSLASFTIQVSKGAHLNVDLGLLGLFAGILVTSYLFKIGMSKIPVQATGYLRKIVFTLVVGLAIAKIF